MTDLTDPELNDDDKDDAHDDVLIARLRAIGPLIRDAPLDAHEQVMLARLRWLVAHS